MKPDNVQAGVQLGRLVTTGRSRRRNGRVQWECKCVCDNPKWADKYNLLRGATKSCGCLHRERTAAKHLIRIEGKRFGRLTALNKHKRVGKWVHWLCRCDCGCEKWVDGKHLRHGGTKSCGCLEQESRGKAQRLQLAGQQFGKLLVLNESKSVDSQMRWLCRCDCGTEKWLVASAIKSGNTRSCGCLQAIEAALSAQRRKQNRVALTDQQKAELRRIQVSEPKNTPEWVRASVLLLADESSGSPAMMDTAIATALEISEGRAFYIRQTFSNPQFRNKQNLNARVRWGRDSSYRVAKLISHRVREALRKQLRKKSARTTAYLGCSIQELMVYLEARFKPDMSWSNFGSRGWHLDHIKPCAAFDLSKKAELKACFHFTNYQPLWSSENTRKSSKWQGKHWRHMPNRKTGAVTVNSPKQ